eukprot:COSAG01_NODE_3330_length_6246_cov_4.593298_7_plen_50_part_00
MSATSTTTRTTTKMFGDRAEMELAWGGGLVPDKARGIDDGRRTGALHAS